jgi:isocitrate/isopropylmalate dehydrogenase
MSHTIVVLHGDQTGEELLQQALRVLDPSVIGLELRFQHCDLSLERRRATSNLVVEEAAAAMIATGYGLKAATITPDEPGDVGSPNILLRERIGASVIVRTGRRIPGVSPIGGVHGPVAVIRMAVGETYGAKEWRTGQGEDEVACRTERITRWHCRAVAEYAFRHAEAIGAKVFGGPKYTVSRVYEGLLKEEMDDAARRHPSIPYEPQLIDATYALLLKTRGEPLVIPALNRDGDCLSELILQMFGSIAGSESLLLAFDDTWNIRVVMAEAPHGTAPLLFGKNLANPMAMILAAASLLSYMGDRPAASGRAITDSVFDAVADGVRTADLQGRAGTSEFTDEVIRRVTAVISRQEGTHHPSVKRT